MSKHGTHKGAASHGLWCHRSSPAIQPDSDSSTRRGRCVRDRRVITTPARLTHAFADHGPMRILLETGTESEWVAQALESAGHEVIVADPNYAPMYGERTRRIKTDRRDGRRWPKRIAAAGTARRIVCLRRSERPVRFAQPSTARPAACEHRQLGPIARETIGLSLSEWQLRTHIPRGWRGIGCRRAG